MLTETPETKINRTAADLGITMTTVFVPWSMSRNNAEKHPSLNWLVTIHKDGRAILTTDYMAGSAHCPGYKQGDRSLSQAELVAWECEHGRPGWITGGGSIMTRGGKPIMPNLADVLYSLASDSDVLDASTFEDWANEFGFDADSRQAEKTYRACLEIALKLRNALGEAGLTALREATRDY